MNKHNNNIAKKSNQKTMKAVIDALVTKKELKSRVQNGEKLKKVAKEKGFNVVLPL